MGRTIARTLAALAVAVAGLTASVAASGAASAAPAGSAHTAPAHTVPAHIAAQPTANELEGIWCASIKGCIAVGSDRNGPSPLSETWNGSAWKKVGVKLPAKLSHGRLFDLSCLSGRDCVAVGMAFASPVSAHALAETWTGSGWKPALPPAPAGQATVLTGISCRSARSCVAVGSDTVKLPLSGPGAGSPGAAALSDLLVGTTWVRKPVPVPKGTLISQLNKVSCPAAGFCMAVGGIEAVSGAGTALVDVWNGKAWSLLKPAKLPAGVTDASLNAVSCASATHCVAVGFAGGGGLSAISEVWNGKTWSYAKVSWPKGVKNTLLLDVACLSASHCIAVGSTGNNPNAEGLSGRTAATLWNGKAWSAMSVPAPAKGRFSLFNGVDCHKAFCAAAGQTGPRGTTNGIGLAGFTTGGSWKLVAAK
ncbi:hypothetical protein EAS64_21000 [Trebonia kvetii]|uniref:Uncharacterized protein n=1 Tax=Trebonia kvetii TaxID=2480626 RepID=A0A6P2BVM3_9ACTN|nr:hypothetical protein [Trebonia kvetii]TVZ02950.1 hypothetical protein EAS64_21000 [Trebonia kvetii]